MISRLATVCRLELVSAARTKWIRLFAAAFALLAAGSAWSAGSARELMGAEGFARTTVAMVPAVVLLVPLVAMLLGVSGHSAEPGCDDFLHAQPVGRFEVLLGRWLGQGAAMGCALAVGFGAGASVIAWSAGFDDLSRFAVFAGATFALSLAFLALAALVSSVTERRVAALAAAAFVWFFFVLLFDAAALTAAGWLTGRAGGRLLMASVFANPADLMRVLTLTLAGTPNLLGPAGESWHRFLGGPVPAAAFASAGLAAWIVLPLAAARVAVGRRDL